MKNNRWMQVALSVVAALALIACARAFGQSQAATPAPGFSIVADDETPLDLTVILGVDVSVLERSQLASSGQAPSSGPYVVTKTALQQMSHQLDAVVSAADTSCLLMEY